MSKRNLEYTLYESLETNGDMIRQVWKTFTHLDAGFSRETVTDKVDKAEFKLGWSILFSSLTMFFCVVSYAFLLVLVGIEKSLGYIHKGIRILFSIISIVSNLVLLSPVIAFVFSAFHPVSGRRRKYTDLLIKKS